MSLTTAELTAARDFLRQAAALVAGVRALFWAGGEAATAARLKDISGRLEDEISAINRLLP
jgi:hypothetical protein